MQFKFGVARALVLALALIALVTVKRADAYYDDVHYAYTYYIARQTGFTPAQAYRIASAASATDWDPDTEPVQPIGQLKILLDPVLSHTIRGTRYVDPARMVSGLLNMDPRTFFSGLNPMREEGQTPRWKFHAMRNELEFEDVIGGGNGAAEADAAIRRQREALFQFAMKTSKNPGVFVHAFQDEAPHHGYGTNWGHWPIVSDEAAKHGGSLTIGGTTDWISSRPSDVEMMGPACSEYLRKFMDSVSPHQRWRPSKVTDYSQLVARLAAVNKAPLPLNSVLKRKLYIQYYAQENGLNITLGAEDPVSISDLGAQLNGAGLSKTDLLKQKNGPDVLAAINAVGAALKAAGMDDAVPLHHIPYNLDKDGNLADQDDQLKRNDWVLVGSLQVTLESDEILKGNAGYRTTVKMKPTRKGEQEYALHGLDQPILRPGEAYTWKNLPIGDLILEIQKPDGTTMRREVALRIENMILPPIRLTSTKIAPPNPGKGPVWVLKGTKVSDAPEGYGVGVNSASFRDGAGNSGSATWTPPPPTLRPGQTVPIQLTTSKMAVTMFWGTGKNRAMTTFLVRDPTTPSRPSLNTTLDFQPNSNRPTFQVSILAISNDRRDGVTVHWFYEFSPGGVGGGQAAPSSSTATKPPAPKPTVTPPTPTPAPKPTPKVTEKPPTLTPVPVTPPKPTSTPAPTALPLKISGVEKALSLNSWDGTTVGDTQVTDDVSGFRMQTPAGSEGGATVWQKPLVGPDSDMIMFYMIENWKPEQADALSVEFLLAPRKDPGSAFLTVGRRTSGGNSQHFVSGSGANQTLKATGMEQQFRIRWEQQELVIFYQDAKGQWKEYARAKPPASGGPTYFGIRIRSKTTSKNDVVANMADIG